MKFSKWLATSAVHALEKIKVSAGGAIVITKTEANQLTAAFGLGTVAEESVDAATQALNPQGARAGHGTESIVFGQSSWLLEARQSSVLSPDMCANTK